MSGQTSFNREINEAEHLMIQDAAAKKDIDSRQMLGDYLKQIAANNSTHHHAKNKDGCTLEPIRRMSISVNKERNLDTTDFWIARPSFLSPPRPGPLCWPPARRMACSDMSKNRPMVPKPSMRMAPNSTPREHFSWLQPNSPNWHPSQFLLRLNSVFPPQKTQAVF
jgi:hypothetical protein